MDLRSCDLCGSLVQAPVPPGSGESLVCEACLGSRRVRPDPGAADAGRGRHARHIHKFRCLYCDRKLRSKPVAQPVQLACPACGGGLRLLPDGRVVAAETGGSSDDHAEVVLRPHETRDPA